MKPHLIGIYSSSMRSGKSTVALMMMDKLFGMRMGFAEPFYDFVISIAGQFIGSEGEARAWLLDDRKDNKFIPGLADGLDIPVTIRRMLQTIGTQWGRDCVDPAMWTKLAEKRAAKALKSYSVIFDDLRFPNEFDMIKRLGGTTVRIIRPGDPRGDTSTGEGLLDNHEFDHVIQNTGTLADLKTSVGALLRLHYTNEHQ